MTSVLKNKLLENKSLLVAAFVFLLAFCLRAIYLYQSTDNPTFYTPVVDSETYDRLARGLVQGTPMTKEFFWQQFFYPFFLSIVYFFSRSSVLCAKIIQIILGSLTCVLTYRLARKTFSPAIGLLAGFILALYGPLIFFEAELLAAGWAAFWFVVLITLFIRTAEENKLLPCLMLGICAALSIITRPNFVLPLAASGLWMLSLWLKKKVRAARIVFALLFIAAGFAAVTLPVAALNYHITNRFSPLPATGGLNLYIGNSPDFDGESIRPGFRWEEITQLPLKHGLTAPNRQQRFFYEKTLQYIRTKPSLFLRGLLRKTAQLLCSREPPGNIDIYLFTKYSPLLSLLTWKISGFGFPFGFLLPLALLGLFLCWRSTPPPLLLFCVFYPVTIILTHIEARYRVPVVVPLSILAAAAISEIFRLVRLRLWRSVSFALAFCIAAGFLCSIPGPFYAEKNIDYNAELYYVLAGSLEKRGKIDDALQSYSKAIDLKNDYTEAHYNIGLLLLKNNDADSALVHLRKAFDTDPHNSNLLRDLGLVLFMTGRIDDALEHYYKALEIDPANALAHTYIAQALKSKGRLDSAVEHYQKALNLDPDSADTHYNLALVLQMLGRLDEALFHYERTIKLNPRSINARSNLAVILAGRGEFESAVNHLNDAIKIEPDSPNLHLNLAVIYDKTHRPEKAAEETKKALDLAKAKNDTQLADFLAQKLRQYRQNPPDPNTTE